MSTKTMHTRVAMALLAAAAAVGVPSEARGQATEVRCPEGQGPQLDLGIVSTGFYRANLVLQNGRMIWNFDGEPVINSVRLGGPAQGKLEPDDQVVSIDGLLITSVEGGRRWSGVRAGRTVTLVVRRSGREREVRIDASTRCERLFQVPRWARERFGRDSAGHALSITWSRPPGDSATRQRTPRDSVARARLLDGYGNRSSARARGEYLRRLGPVRGFFRVLFGFGLRCDDCYFETDSSNIAVAWRFSAPPIVTMVEEGGPAARAGLRVDDVLEAVDGVPIVGEDGGQRFSTAQPGRPVRFTVRRGGETLTLELVPESSAPRRQTPPPDRPE